jgi:hypothetical protein
MYRHAFTVRSNEKYARKRKRDPKKFVGHLSQFDSLPLSDARELTKFYAELPHGTTDSTAHRLFV